MNTTEKMQAFCRIVRKAKKIQKSGADPEVIYHLFFGGITKEVLALDLQHIDYCDPDTSYEQDVAAYMSALTSRAEEYEKILDALGENIEDD